MPAIDVNQLKRKAQSENEKVNILYLSVLPMFRLFVSISFFFFFMRSISYYADYLAMASF